jgi:hypothetical protein
MAVTIQRTGNVYELGEVEAVVGMGLAIPGGIAGMLVGFAIAEHRNNPTLYNTLQHQKEYQQDLLSGIHAINSDATLKAIGANPKKVNQAEQKIQKSIATISASQPHQYSANEQIGMVIGGELGGAAITFGLTVAAMRAKARIQRNGRLKKAEYTKTLKSLASDLVTHERYAA